MSKITIFSAALMLFAVSAEDDISHSMTDMLDHNLHDHHPIVPTRGLNLASMMPDSIHSETDLAAEHVEG